MDNGSEITNKVALSGIITIDPETFFPRGERALFDLKEYLFEGLILREKDFREKLNAFHWESLKNKFVAVTCSADVIIPTWAYMLVATRLEPIARKIVFGNLEQLEEALFNMEIDQLPFDKYRDQRVVIKGCSNISVPVSVYVHLTSKLRPLVKSLMYGEPCSTVPVYKRD